MVTVNNKPAQERVDSEEVRLNLHKNGARDRKPSQCSCNEEDQMY